jgi:hypothetical protein
MKSIAQFVSASSALTGTMAMFRTLRQASNVPARRFPPPWTVEDHNYACFGFAGQDDAAVLAPAPVQHFVVESNLRMQTDVRRRKSS